MQTTFSLPVHSTRGDRRRLTIFSDEINCQANSGEDDIPRRPLMGHRLPSVQHHSQQSGRLFEKGCFPVIKLPTCLPSTPTKNGKARNPKMRCFYPRLGENSSLSPDFARLVAMRIGWEPWLGRQQRPRLTCFLWNCASETRLIRRLEVGGLSIAYAIVICA